MPISLGARPRSPFCPVVMVRRNDRSVSRLAASCAACPASVAWPRWRPRAQALAQDAAQRRQIVARGPVALGHLGHLARDRLGVHARALGHAQPLAQLRQRRRSPRRSPARPCARSSTRRRRRRGGPPCDRPARSMAPRSTLVLRRRLDLARSPRATAPRRPRRARWRRPRRGRACRRPRRRPRGRRTRPCEGGARSWGSSLHLCPRRRHPARELPAGRPRWGRALSHARAPATNPFDAVGFGRRPGVA